MTMTAPATWLEAFFDVLGAQEFAEPLKAAANGERLSAWTTLLTDAVVEACRRIDWVAAGKGHRLERLPQAGQEYLGLDVTAFRRADAALASAESADGRSIPRWPLPIAVFELENSRRDDRVAYSLWKVLCVRSPMRVVFAYRGDWDTGRLLAQALAHAVVEPMSFAERSAIDGDVLLLLGSRGGGETFPHGYFKVWRLDPGIAVFRKIG